MKPTVIFVGSFRSTIDGGGVGGQMYACRSLLNSPISEHVQWRLIDSTMQSLPPPGLLSRGIRAAGRTLKLLFELLRRPQARVLIFAGDGPSFAEKGLMALLARLLRHRVVFSPRSGMLVDDLQRSAIYRWFIPVVLRHASVVLCQSIEWRNLFMSLVGHMPGKFVVVPNWISVDEYARVVRSHDSNLCAEVVVLYLGWLEKFKGIYDLLDAISICHAELGRVRFVICGAGSEIETVKQLVNDRGLARIVEFRGWVTGEAKYKALSEADLLVLPSHREGMPNAVLEAMASALPVVATRVGGIPAIIDHGVNGFLVEPENSLDLAAKLVLACGDPEQLLAMGKAARRRILDNHDVQKQWRTVFECIEGGHESR